MSAVNLLYQLQEIDQELESNEQALKQLASQLGESEAVVNARNKLALERELLGDLEKKQHSLEWEIDDLNEKLSTIEKELYGGKIHNPKELTNKQQEFNELKSRRNQLEDETLGLMEQFEHTTHSVAALDGELKALESEWKSQQQQLSDKVEQLKTIISNLTQKRQALVTGVDPETLEVYLQLKKQKRTAVARVEQGICCGCRISLPVNELQLARSGSLVRCGSCGRILFLA